jgi:predicted ATPase
MLFLRRFVELGHDLERRRILSQRTLWINQPRQTFELEAFLDGSRYVYCLVLDSYGEPERARVVSESVSFDEKVIFKFEDGKVNLFDDHFQHKVAYPFDWHRSALATITEIKDNRRLIRFKEWFSNFYCFRINPFKMEPRAEDEDSYPYYDLRNFAAWYRHLIQSDRSEDAALLESLRAALDGFSVLKLDRVGRNIRSLVAEFKSAAATVEVGFDNLSDGQRCLIGLYTILHFIVAKGNTIILDEPDNFIALREIQPWLNALSDTIVSNRGQVLIISHHPELMNQWAPNFGVRFVRDDMGPVRVKEFSADAESTLLPSEIIARGWEE